jgi:hypothetical protein
MNVELKHGSNQLSVVLSFNFEWLQLEAVNSLCKY